MRLAVARRLPAARFIVCGCIAAEVVWTCWGSRPEATNIEHPLAAQRRNTTQQAVAVHARGSAQRSGAGSRAARKTGNLDAQVLQAAEPAQGNNYDSEIRSGTHSSLQLQQTERPDKAHLVDAHRQQEIDGLREALQILEEDAEANVPAAKAPPWPSFEKAAPAFLAVNFLAFLGCTLSMLAYMSAWPFSFLLSQPASVVDRVQGYALSDRFFGNFIYSIVLPDSFGLSTLLSEGATFSGWIIGIYKGLSLLGLGFSLILCGVHNKGWIRNLYPCIVTGKVMAFAGSLMFLFIVMYRDSVPHAKHWILFSRAVAGTGYGIGMIPVELIFVHTTTSEERPVMLSAAVFNVTLGIGLGPLFASVTRNFYVALSGSSEGALEAVMCLPLVASLVSLVAIFFVAGGEEYIKAPVDDVPAEIPNTLVQPAMTFVEQPDFTPRRIGIVVCALIVGIRAAICAGLEAATAMILERDYSWSKSTVGIAIGLSFMLSVPGRMLFMFLKDRLSIIESIRLNMLSSFVASLFLFKAVQNVFTLDNGGSALGLLFAGSILYCAIYQVSGLIEGIMTTFALPTGSYFTVDNVILLKLVMLDSIGRTFGPPLARMLVEAGGKDNGQDCYAWHQLSMTLAAALLTEAVLLRSMDAIRKRRKSHRASVDSKGFSASVDSVPLTGGLVSGAGSCNRGSGDIMDMIPGPGKIIDMISGHPHEETEPSPPLLQPTSIAAPPLSRSLTPVPENITEAADGLNGTSVSAPLQFDEAANDRKADDTDV